MQRDSNRRYESAELLALEVEVYMADAPASAFEEDLMMHPRKSEGE